MRILNVTQTYFPFLEFGGPAVKVRALSEALARRGHHVTVLTADWGLESRWSGNAEQSAKERSEFGWRVEANGVEAIYLPTWLRFRALSWNPGTRRFCRARLRNFDVVHIFGLYDFLGPAVAEACRASGPPYVVEPIGMFLPIVGNLRLVFAGPDEGLKKGLLRSAERLGVASRVQFCGPLFGEAKWAAYRDADVFVLPSQNENFGNSAAEAIAAGTPVLVTNRCGIAPLLEDMAGLVVAHEAAAVAHGLERMLHEPGLHSRLAGGCRRVAAGLDWAGTPEAT